MMLVGRIWKAEGGWLAECDAVYGLTQGRSRKDACFMLGDLIFSMVGRRGFKATVTELAPDGDDAFTVLIDANDPTLLAALVLRRQRERQRLSPAAVAKKLGADRDDYERYERGTAKPTLTKFLELLAAVAPDMTLTLRPRAPRAKPRRRSAAR